jgi:hypothetical protein
MTEALEKILAVTRQLWIAEGIKIEHNLFTAGRVRGQSHHPH